MARPTPQQKIAIQERRKKAASLYLRGELQWSIAHQLGVNQKTISRDLQAIRAEWQQSALIDYDQVKARELAEIDEIDREAWASWKRSQENAENEEAGKSSKSQVGDPRFLHVALECSKRRCAILGIEAPKETKMKLLGPDGGPIQIVDKTLDEQAWREFVARNHPGQPEDQACLGFVPPDGPEQPLDSLPAA
jgi:hypothetical protein